MPHAPTRIRISPPPISGIGTSLFSSGLPICTNRTAFIGQPSPSGENSRISRNVRPFGATLNDLRREPFAPFQKFGLAGTFPSFRSPVPSARPKTENRATREIVHNLEVDHSMRNHVAGDFESQTKLKNLMLCFRV